MQKRLSKEYTKLIENGAIISDFGIDKNSNVESIEIDYNNLKIIFKFPKNYPFSPPSITINSKNYIDTLAKYHKNNASFKVEGNNKCLCCNSLVCKNNWGPVNTLLDLYNEIKKNFEYIDVS